MQVKLLPCADTLLIIQISLPWPKKFKYLLILFYFLLLWELGILPYVLLYAQERTKEYYCTTTESTVSWILPCQMDRLQCRKLLRLTKHFVVSMWASGIFPDLSKHNGWDSKLLFGMTNVCFAHHFLLSLVRVTHKEQPFLHHFIGCVNDHRSMPTEHPESQIPAPACRQASSMCVVKTEKQGAISKRWLLSSYELVDRKKQKGHDAWLKWFLCMHHLFSPSGG